MVNIINPYIHNKMNKNRVKQLIKLSQSSASGKSLVDYLNHVTFSTLELHDVNGVETFFGDAEYIGTNSLERGEFLVDTSKGQFKVSTALTSQFSELTKGDKVEVSLVTVPPRVEGQVPLVSVKKVFVD
jgi:hypothetical protein